MLFAIALCFAACDCDDNGTDSQDDKPAPCESTPQFDDLTSGEYESYGELCSEAGIDIGVLEFGYSEERKRFRLRGTYASIDAPHYVFGQNADKKWCFVELDGGSFEIGVAYEHCTDEFSLDIMSEKPTRFRGTWSAMNVVCPFSVRMLPFPSDCEEQPAGEDD
ncbi:MAG: hypothetical protein IT350_03975 [Deltaproteobacteria bacterium]|nr:hypothetical protein [Deltaproteobacteria bacterium]